ncbi:MAG: prepilin-type N-terminal cleavage/methylation domain-containing protein [Desulfomonile tiedjei]|uniref:Prepilin-type N-terminal cleavage/methylation domain-containing protein n=1 Tax=Desulfomonile tiedjei TaxID=2358 RepID=A0A9D6Z5B0_9BACT|nr:prepilin-type N-terminal cleavage/methylation domain-containing protein [Desulfomonile tiedjei]
MKSRTSQAGFTILEMAFAIVIIAILAAIYFFLIDSYRERRMSEHAAKVLMLAARAQEDYFAKEHRYFDAEVAGQGTDLYLSAPDGRKTEVLVPGKVVLSLKTRGKDKTAFTGYAFYTGSKMLHRYDSATGKMTTSSRTQDDAG